jgi:hypothetical protein
VSQELPGAHSVVAVHLFTHKPTGPQRYGAQLLDVPSFAIDVSPSSLQRAPSTQRPSGPQMKPAAQSSVFSHLPLQAPSAQT